MSFYMKPPRGEVNLYILLECVQQRINCFSNLENDVDIRDIDKFEFLVEDSILDRTGHFIFRLGVVANALPRNIFIQNEMKLLNKRLDYYNKHDMEYFLKNIIRQLKDCIRLDISKELSEFYWKLYNVVSKMLQKDYLSHVLKHHTNKTEEQSCNNGLCILIPFWYCNKLIATRKVDLRNGNVVFECRQWKEILLALYTSYLNIVLNEMQHSKNVATTLIDGRILGCVQMLRDHFLKRTDTSTETMSLEDIKQESVYFPLCMKNLYDLLKKNHRLAHNERFDLSLFLKGVGLTMDDSITFWQSEYSKQHTACSKCSHSWQDNEKKYIYSIKHLYGLEGSRKNYSMKSCNHLQDSGSGINCEGGCPFVHYDDDSLRSTLKKNLPDFEDDIEVMIFERKENPSVSCKLYSECVSKRHNHNISDKESFDNPVQYYNQLKNKKPTPP